MLELSNISFSYGNSQVLKNLNLSIADQSFHSLIGLSGAGKTLILKLISGLENVQSGTITKKSSHLSYVFQNAELFPWLTIEKNLHICCRLPHEEVHAFLKQFRLEHTSSMFPHQLSGGTLKKVGLLRAFLLNAELILMDEPFAHLDLAQKEEIYSFTLELWNQFKPTIVLVTHDLDEAIYLSTDISYLSKKAHTIVENYKVTEINKQSFNESKIDAGHIDAFARILSKLKGELQ